MNIAEWILVGFLSVALFVFLVAGITAFLKIRELAEEAKKVVIKGQDIADTASDIADTVNDVAENVKGITSVGTLVKNFTDRANTRVSEIDDALPRPKKTPKTKTEKPETEKPAEKSTETKSDPKPDKSNKKSS